MLTTDRSWSRILEWKHCWKQHGVSQVSRNYIPETARW